MEARAIAKYVRIAPRKVNLVAAEIRGKNIDEALAILKFTPKRGAKELEKVLKSAVANAENNLDLDRENLYVLQAYANQGPTLKRWRPRSQGRAYSILKRTSHVGIVVAERE
ncbi:50S ribosomal protein L22 [Gottschalkia acidurici 9a]|uniref:Large ribosomal subunit protein uL22 n=1 Tax=Gottschalkia acidurici (strain ATCC 7906 / DSM 604 / BCRC 14475 / CIP 104303 / KCTC 5404 / NCIMB 10678 / 9a) TaxID=1128398 RepID=K0B3V2_GOTA9|nr:50S ribosomal protein L22 [Gottschalkia acidurici]AFS79261.1 50S ribosomal protein L22 [Gottschalkia acidurici 9a]